MPYSLIDHTADIGIVVRADSLEALFADAALALTDLLVKTDGLKARQVATLTAEGLDLPDLLVAWLRECLYRFNGRRQLIESAQIRSLAPTHLVAEVALAPFDTRCHRIRQEIKAVTYHQVRVEQTRAGWEARVIFDT